MWNHAKVLVMSLRLTTPALAKEMLDAWLRTPPAPKQAAGVAKVAEIKRAYGVRPARTGNWSRRVAAHLRAGAA